MKRFLLNLHDVSGNVRVQPVWRYDQSTPPDVTTNTARHYDRHNRYDPTGITDASARSGQESFTKPKRCIIFGSCRFICF